MGTRLIALIASLAVLTAACGGTATSQAPSPSPSAAPSTAAAPVAPASVVTWNAVAQRAAVTNAKMYQTQSLIYIAYVQAAVYDAAVGVAGRYQPYAARISPRPGASLEAAVATAAHDVLVRYFAAQASAIDADLAASLAAIPEGAPKSDGIAIGRQAAAALIAQRLGDGLEADIGFVVPPAAPGSWLPPAGQTPQTPWVSKMKPFTLTKADAFRSVPPPAITSEQFATDLNELRAVGGAASTARTAEQTDVAKFWTTNSVIQYLGGVKAAVEARKLDAVDAARLYAITTLIASDALIACFDAKYAYLFWRPQYAIPDGASAKNPKITSDPAWTPLAATPNHPEYPAAHGCLTGAEAGAFAAALGTQQIDLDLSASVPGLVKTSRHYATVSELETEIVNARVWAGLHYRTSVLEGLALAHKVVAAGLAGRFARIP